MQILSQYFANNEDRFIAFLRISLGLIFLWFGALKAAGYNPVYDIVYSAFPFFADGIGNTILGTVEALIGVGLLLNIFPALVHAALIAHLSGTFIVFITGPELMYEPHFPILTLSGEFVFKNVTLAAAGLVVLAHHYRYPKH